VRLGEAKNVAYITMVLGKARMVDSAKCI